MLLLFLQLAAVFGLLFLLCAKEIRKIRKICNELLEIVKKFKITSSNNANFTNNSTTTDNSNINVNIDIGNKENELKKVKDRITHHNRPYIMGIAWQMIMGYGFYKNGFLSSCTRSLEMQKCKTEIIMAMNKRIYANAKKQ
eukprot:Pgem_evm2s6721